MFKTIKYGRSLTLQWRIFLIFQAVFLGKMRFTSLFCKESRDILVSKAMFTRLVYAEDEQYGNDSL